MPYARMGAPGWGVVLDQALPVTGPSARLVECLRFSPLSVVMDSALRSGAS